MIKLNLNELVYLLLTFDNECFKDEDYIVNNFIGNSFDVLEVLSELTENVPVILDCIQFNSEDEDLYCLSVEELEEEAVLVSVVSAVNKTNGKFYAINGNMFVADYVSEDFEDDVVGYKHANPGHIVRFVYTDNSCENCEHKDCCDLDKKDNHEISTEKDDHFITQSWSDGNSYFSRSFSSSDPKMLDKISKEWSEFETKFRKG